MTKFKVVNSDTWESSNNGTTQKNQKLQLKYKDFDFTVRTQNNGEGLTSFVYEAPDLNTDYTAVKEAGEWFNISATVQEIYDDQDIPDEMDFKCKLRVKFKVNGTNAQNTQYKEFDLAAWDFDEELAEGDEIILLSVVSETYGNTLYFKFISHSEVVEQVDEYKSLISKSKEFARQDEYLEVPHGIVAE